MEEKKKEYKTGILQPNKFVPILIYILFFFILSALITYLVAYIYSNANNVDYEQIKASFTMKTEEFKDLSPDILKANAVTQGFSNFIVYFLAGSIIVFFTRDEFKKDLFKFKEKKNFYLWFIPVAVISFVLICYLIDLLFKQITPSSENQQQIMNIIKNGGAIPMIITTIILAPLLEELVFRKCIFSLCGKNRIVLAYIASIILFVLPHMLSTRGDIGTWILQCIPYIVAAGLFATIYHLSGFNFYVTLLCHMANNILAVIIVFI